MDDIIEFINRRFPKDCNWLDGNCYYFALILKDRFPNGIIYYDVIRGHFVFGINDKYYDWSGEVKNNRKLIEWDKFDKYDTLVKQRVIDGSIK